MARDSFDLKILDLVQDDAGATADKLAEQVGISASSVQRRLRRLREDGVIAREIAVLDPRKLGRPMSFVVSVQVERETPDRLARFRQWLIAEPHVQQVFYVTGETDYILVVVTPDAESYDSLMARMVGDNPNVKRFTTQVTLNVIKRGLRIPVLGAQE